MSESPLVGIVMGSQSDMAVMEECARQLEALGVPYELLVASAHRQPAKVHEWAGSAESRGLRVIIAAAAGPQQGSFQRVLGSAPLRQVGLLSYSLYLWHWPVIVFLTANRTGWPQPVVAIAQLGLSALLAWLSLRFVEGPIRARGFGALVPGRRHLSRVLTAATVPVIAAGTLWLGWSANGAVGAGPTASVELGAESYDPLPGVHDVTLLGNSIPASMADGFDAAAYPDLRLSTVVNFGCDVLDGLEVVAGRVQEPSDTCARWRWQDEIRGFGTELTVFYVPQSAVYDRSVDGRTLTFGTPPWRRWLHDALDRLRRSTTAAGSRRLAVVDVACHRLQSDRPEATLLNDDARVRVLDDAVAGWARDRGVPLVEQHAALCTGGYHDAVDGVPLYKDGLHFSPDSAAQMWRWLAPHLQRILRG